MLTYLEDFSIYFLSGNYYHFRYVIDPVYDFFYNIFNFPYLGLPFFLETSPIVLENKYLFYLLQVFWEGIFYCLGGITGLGGQIFSLNYSGGVQFHFFENGFFAIPTAIFAMSFSFLGISYLFGFIFKKIFKNYEKIVKFCNKNIVFIGVFCRGLPFLGLFSALAFGLSNIKFSRKLILSILGSIYMLAFVLIYEYCSYYGFILKVYNQGTPEEYNIFLYNFIIYIQIILSLVFGIIVYKFYKKL